MLEDKKDKLQEFEKEQMDYFYKTAKQLSEWFEIEVNLSEPYKLDGQININATCEDEDLLKLLELKLAQWQFENALTHKNNFLIMR